MGVEPFQSILSRLGASVFGYEMDGDTTSVEGIHRYLSFDAPDVVTAESLEKEFKTYLAGSLASEQNLPPWHDDAENFKHVFEGKSLLVGDAVRCYQDRWTEGYRLAERVTKSSDRIHRLYEKSLKRLAVSRHQGFQRAGLHFTFRDLIFENEELGLSAMIAYLEVRGCTNIDFRYSKDNPSTNHD